MIGTNNAADQETVQLASNNINNINAGRRLLDDQVEGKPLTGRAWLQPPLLMPRPHQVRQKGPYQGH